MITHFSRLTSFAVPSLVESGLRGGGDSQKGSEKSSMEKILFIVFNFLLLLFLIHLLALAYLHQMTVNLHTSNLVLLVIDTFLNRLRFPLFRFCYFILWTGSFVIFQWILHVFISVGWPYPFLDLSMKMAPVWYLLVALLHLPSYGLYTLFVKIKQKLTT